MGREVYRVPLDFAFPVGESFADYHYRRFVEAGFDPDSDDFPYWGSEVPKGDGWQLWNTVSDGPITPVFATADELIEYMCQPAPPRKHRQYRHDPYPDNPWDQGWKRDVAEKFVKGVGWAPSFVMVGGKVMDGPEFMVHRANEEKAIK